MDNNNNNSNQDVIIEFGNSINPSSNTKPNQSSNQQTQIPSQPQNTTQTQVVQTTQQNTIPVIQPTIENQIVEPTVNNTQVVTQQPITNPEPVQSHMVETPTNQVMTNEELQAKITEAKEQKQEDKNRSVFNVIFLIFFKFILPPIVIIFVLYTLYSNGLLNGRKQKVFIETANDYLKAAHEEFEKSQDPTCEKNTVATRKILLNELINANTNSISSYGGTLNLSKSYVNIKSTYNGSDCNYEFSIYLTDDNYSIGTENNPVVENNVSKAKVNKLK